MSRHPPVKWAQRSDEVYITVELPDAQDVKLKLEPEGKFYFSATTGSEKIPYEIDIDLFDKVDVNNSKVSVGSRNIFYIVTKAEDKWWDRLLKQGGKPPAFLKVDWDKWVDEDDEVDEDGKMGADMDFGNFDLSKLSMGGGEELDTEATNNADDVESDAEDDVTGQTSIDNEADTKEKVDVASTDPNPDPIQQPNASEGSEVLNDGVIKKGPIRKSGRERTEDEVTGQTSIDNEADTKEKVDVASTDPDPNPIQQPNASEGSEVSNERVIKKGPIRKSGREKKAPVWAKDYYMGK